LAGPRQVGKSTLVIQVLAKINFPHTFASADRVESSDAEWIGALWEEARSKKRFTRAAEYILVIDEIHKIDKWSEYVKAEWDKDTRLENNIKVLILGSSRILLKSGLDESLAGRFCFREMEK